MAQVTVTIAGRVYRMACGEGEESHLEGLARRVDAKIHELREAFGPIGDQRLIVMAALTFADGLSEAEHKITSQAADIDRLAHAGEALLEARSQNDQTNLEWMEDASHRIEQAIKQLNRFRASSAD